MPTGLRQIIALSVLLLSACSTRPTHEPATVDPYSLWQQHQQQLSQLQHWSLKGRISLATDNQASSASVHWQQQSDRYFLRILGPFGQQRITVEGSAVGVTLTDAQGRVMSANNAEELLWRQSGWRLPLQDLQYWILGVPANAQQQFNLNADGQLSSLHSQSWRIDYTRYRQVGEYWLPDKLQLHNPQLRIKLAISEWSVP